MENMDDLDPKEDQCDDSEEGPTLSELISLNKKKKRSNNPSPSDTSRKCGPAKRKRNDSTVKTNCQSDETSHAKRETGKSSSPGSCKNCSYCSDHCPTEKGRQVLSKRATCTLCKEKGVRRTFKSEESLSVHIKNAHSDEDGGNKDDHPIFLCSLCCESEACSAPLLFTTKTKYLNHMMSEHQTQMFICDICSSSFKLKANYKSHMLTHNVEPKKAFKCEVCNGTFVNRAGFDAHQKRFPGPHIKQTCVNCGISFSKEQYMKNHRCRTLLLQEASAQAAETTGNVKLEAVDTAEEEISYRPNDTLEIEEVPDEVRDSEQLIIRELAGQIPPGTQVLQFEVGDVEQPQQVYQVNVADWNIVAPFVIRDPSHLTTLQQASRAPE